jgi:hypothetical protein
LIPGRPFLISSLVKGRKLVACEKEKVFTPKSNNTKLSIFLIQNCILMANDKTYTWTISVIVIYNENEIALKEAYEEFEESIRAIQNPNKDIRFVIFFYNSNTEIVEIRKSHVINGAIILDVCEELGKVDIYERKHEVLKSFFRNHVAKTSIEDNEEHKHMVITWCHGAGLGFMKQEIEKRLTRLYDSRVLHGDENKSHEIVKIASSIYDICYLTTNLSLNKDNEIYNNAKKYVFDLAGFNDLLGDEKDMKDEVEKMFRVITGTELADIMKHGLMEDRSTVNIANEAEPLSSGIKVQIMLCLTCYVNMIETSFSLKDIINVYISPQTDIPFYGYNYKNLFGLLNQDRSVSEMDISSNITHNYLIKYLEPKIKSDRLNRPDLFPIDYKNGVSFSSVYLRDCQAIVLKIRDFVDFIHDISKKKILNNGLTIKEIINEARFKCSSLAKIGASDIGVIDYQNFITEILSCFERVNMSNFEKFFSSDQIISDYTPGSSCRSVYISGLFKFISPSPGSYSIFFPNVPLSPLEKILIKIYKRMRRTQGSFLKTTGWDSLII